MVYVVFYEISYTLLTLLSLCTTPLAIWLHDHLYPRGCLYWDGWCYYTEDYQGSQSFSYVKRTSYSDWRNISLYGWLQETERLAADPAPGISAYPHEDNLRYFDVVIEGPNGSPFESALHDGLSCERAVLIFPVIQRASSSWSYSFLRNIPWHLRKCVFWPRYTIPISVSGWFHRSCPWIMSLYR